MKPGFDTRFDGSRATRVNRATRISKRSPFALLFGLSVLIGCGAAVSCAEGQPEIRNTDPRLSIETDVYLFMGRPFTGMMRQHLPAVGETWLTPYRDALKEGLEVATHDNGQVLSRGAYVAGEKHGVHRTWFTNGNDKTYAEFNHGKYVNESWSWHSNGLVADYEKYTADGRALAVKRWRSNGLIYMNLVFQNEAPLGMPGSKVCNPTSDTSGAIPGSAVDSNSTRDS